MEGLGPFCGGVRDKEKDDDGEEGFSHTGEKKIILYCLAMSSSLSELASYCSCVLLHLAFWLVCWTYFCGIWLATLAKMLV